MIPIHLARPTLSIVLLLKGVNLPGAVAAPISSPDPVGGLESADAAPADGWHVPGESNVVENLGHLAYSQFSSSSIYHDMHYRSSIKGDFDLEIYRPRKPLKRLAFSKFDNFIRGLYIERASAESWRSRLRLTPMVSFFHVPPPASALRGCYVRALRGPLPGFAASALISYGLHTLPSSSTRMRCFSFKRMTTV
jgi:hypothetical protein